MKPRILIADDQELNRITLEAMLSNDGYALSFARDGEEACAMARSLRPDLILLDVMMPKLDGFKVCRTLRADATVGRVPIIVITALHDQQSRLEGLRAGADDFLTKPCVAEELRARVRTVVSLNRFRAIAEESARFEQLFALAPVAIIVVDQAGTIVTANPSSTATLTSTSSTPVAGSNIFSYFESAAAASIAEVIADALRGSPQPPREIRARSGDQELTLLMRAAPVPAGEGGHVMLILDDVTAERRARRCLEVMNTELDSLVRARTSQLEEANGMLMSYANFVSHDLRSPLSVMKGYLSLLHEGEVALNQDAAPMIGHAYSATIMMEELVRNILQLARSEHDGECSAPSGPVDPRPAIARLAAHLRRLRPAPIAKITISTLPPVGVSAVLVERVFYNLLSNALKYSAQAAEPLIEIGGFESADGPVLFVKDNGIGFDARDADKLFREFSRLPGSEKSDGFGLGLSLVSRMVRAHRGRIWAEGTPGAGATFYVQLPAPVLVHATG